MFQPNATEQITKIGTRTSDKLPPTGDDRNDVQGYSMSTEEAVTTRDDD